MLYKRHTYFKKKFLKTVNVNRVTINCNSLITSRVSATFAQSYVHLTSCFHLNYDSENKVASKLYVKKFVPSIWNVFNCARIMQVYPQCPHSSSTILIYMPKQLHLPKKVSLWSMTVCSYFSRVTINFNSLITLRVSATYEQAHTHKYIFCVLEVYAPLVSCN